MRSNFKSLTHLIGSKVGVIVFGETKLDDCFPKPGFKIPGFKIPCSLDVNVRSAGLMGLTNESIS